MVTNKSIKKIKLILSSIFSRMVVLLNRFIPKNIQANLHNQTFSSEGIERLAAVILDLCVSGLLFLFPLLGWFWGILYFLLKDAFPFLKGQSIGKHFWGLRVVQKGSLTPITGNYKATILRGVIFITPGLNLVDIYFYLTRGERLADKWSDTLVIKELYFISSNNGNEM